MANLSSRTRPGWQPGHMPKLSYRNALPTDDTTALSIDSESIGGVDLERIGPRSGMSIRELRESVAMKMPPPQPEQTQASQLPPTSPRLPQKKKTSVFGGLFQKEPTIVALDQVAAQLVAQHGSTHPHSVPHVSSRKMPQYVPKVNSKWDGIPEVVKTKKKQGKEHDKTFKGHSPPSTSVPSRSHERSNLSSRSAYQDTERRSSNAGSSGSRKSSFAESQHTESTNGRSTTADIKSLWSTSQSLNSPSESSLPVNTSVLPDEGPNPSHGPKHYPSTKSFQSQSSSSSLRNELGLNITNIPIVFDVIPEHTFSATTTPRDASPVTPELQPSVDGISRFTVAAQSAREVDQLAQISVEKKPFPTTHAFLAGEAQPLELSDDESEHQYVSDLPLRNKSMRSAHTSTSATVRLQQDVAKRPDSSRARLGLRASMIVQTDVAPWNGAITLTNSARKSAVTSPVSPRGQTRKSFGMFGKEKP